MPLLHLKTASFKECIEITDRVRKIVRESGDRTIPDHAGYLHDRADNNAQAHIKAAILGPSELIQIENGDLVLGTWQGIIFVELDGPRSDRKVSVEILKIS